GALPILLGRVEQSRAHPGERRDDEDDGDVPGEPEDRREDTADKETDEDERLAPALVGPPPGDVEGEGVADCEEREGGPGGPRTRVQRRRGEERQQRDPHSSAARKALSRSASASGMGGCSSFGRAAPLLPVSGSRRQTTPAAMTSAPA